MLSFLFLRHFDKWHIVQWQSLSQKESVPGVFLSFLFSLTFVYILINKNRFSVQTSGTGGNMGSTVEGFFGEVKMFSPWKIFWQTSSIRRKDGGGVAEGAWWWSCGQMWSVRRRKGEEMAPWEVVSGEPFTESPVGQWTTEQLSHICP